MTNSNPIYIGIAGLGIVMLFTVGMGNNQIPEAEGGFSFPTTKCETAGGAYDHWDKIIFITEGAALRGNGGTPFFNPGTVLEFKFPQVNPFTPIDVAQLTADHLNSLGWSLGNFSPVVAKRIIIIDIDYSATCVFPSV